MASNGRRESQADAVMQLIREGTALQIELLGAAARVWSEIVERVATYNRELTNELMEFSGGNRRADESVDRLVEAGRQHVDELAKLPGRIAESFDKRVRRRAGRPTDR
jgi:hypothetical protein